MRSQSPKDLFDRLRAEKAELDDLLRAADVLMPAANLFNPSDSLIDWLKRVDGHIAKAKQTNNALSDAICFYLHVRENFLNISRATEKDILWLERTIDELKLDYAILEEIGPEYSRYLAWASSLRDG